MIISLLTKINSFNSQTWSPSLFIICICDVFFDIVFIDVANYGDYKAHCVYSPELDATFEEPENFIMKWHENILEYMNLPLKRL